MFGFTPPPKREENVIIVFCKEQQISLTEFAHLAGISLVTLEKCIDHMTGKRGSRYMKGPTQETYGKIHDALRLKNPKEELERIGRPPVHVQFGASRDTDITVIIKHLSQKVGPVTLGDFKDLWELRDTSDELTYEI